MLEFMDCPVDLLLLTDEPVVDLVKPVSCSDEVKFPVA
jgi:hypothetical protein